MSTYEEKVLEIANKEVAGAKVARIRYMTNEEAEEAGWDERGIIIEFDNGHAFGAQRDDEGNGPGALATSLPGSASVLAVLPLLN